METLIGIWITLHIGFGMGIGLAINEDEDARKVMLTSVIWPLFALIGLGVKFGKWLNKQ